MPRMARLQEPGALVHIMARGIDGRNLFCDDEDRYQFLNRFKIGLKKTQYKCYGWILMDNHYHLVVQMNNNPLDSLMGSLNSGYARWYNKKYKRSGYLFQDRFKSVLCQEFKYAKELIRYLHLNPIRANIISSYDKLSEWQWSSHNFIIKNNDAIGSGLIDRDKTLKLFGMDEVTALQNYNHFLQDGIRATDLSSSGNWAPTEQTEFLGSCKGWPAIIGDPEYVKTTMENSRLGLFRKHRKADYQYVLNKSALETCEKFKLTRQELLSRGRMNVRSRARAFFCNQMYDKEKIPLSVIANFLIITLSPTAVLVKKGKLQENVIENTCTVSGDNVLIESANIKSTLLHS